MSEKLPSWEKEGWQRFADGVVRSEKTIKPKLVLKTPLLRKEPVGKSFLEVPEGDKQYSPG